MKIVKNWALLEDDTPIEWHRTREAARDAKRWYDRHPSTTNARRYGHPTTYRVASRDEWRAESLEREMDAAY